MLLMRLEKLGIEPSVTMAMGSRGSSEMSFNGYTYRLRRTYNTKTYWTCKAARCSGSCVLINGDILKILNEHSHEPKISTEKFRRYDFKFGLKDLTLNNPNVKPIELFNIFLKDLEPDAQEYVKKHQKFYTGYVSSIRTKLKSDSVSDGNERQYQGYTLKKKQMIGDSTVWTCAHPNCSASYILDAHDKMKSLWEQHNHQEHSEAVLKPDPTEAQTEMIDMDQNESEIAF